MWKKKARTSEQEMERWNQDTVPVVVDVERSAIVSPSEARLLTVKSVLILCNPKAGAGEGEGIGKEAKKLFEDASIHAKLILLERAGHAESICREHDLSVFDVVCTVGGDGTFHEAANGLLKSKTSHIPLALIPAGTGNSFCIELGVGTNVRRAVDLVLRGLTCLIDVVRIHFDNQPEKEDLYSVNSIHWGLASTVTITAERLRWMGHTVRYTTAALYEFMRGDRTAAKVEFETGDGIVKSYEEEFCMVIANNIRGAAKGMTMAPNAKINDGLVDLLIIRTSSKFDLVQMFYKAYTTAPTEREEVQYEQVKWFSVTPYRSKKHMSPEAEIEEVVDVDGELTGITPFTATVLPRIMNLVI